MTRRFENMSLNIEYHQIKTGIPTHNKICKDIQGHIRQLKTVLMTLTIHT